MRRFKKVLARTPKKVRMLRGRVCRDNKALTING